MGIAFAPHEPFPARMQLLDTQHENTARLFDPTNGANIMLNTYFRLQAAPVAMWNRISLH